MTKHNRTDVLLGGGTSGLDGTCLVHAGVSENSVPLNPMVNDHYPY